MSPIIRVAREADTDAYEEFISAIFAENLVTLVPRGLYPGAGQVRYFITNHAGQRSVLFLAEADDCIVGAINLSRHPRPQRDHSVSVGLNVAAHCRGRGIGRQLLRQGLGWAAQARGVTRVELEVMANNDPAIALYESAGFVREGIKRSAVKKGEQFLDVYLYGLIMH